MTCLGRWGDSGGFAARLTARQGRRVLRAGGGERPVVTSAQPPYSLTFTFTLSQQTKTASQASQSASSQLSILEPHRVSRLNLLRARPSGRRLLTLGGQRSDGRRRQPAHPPGLCLSPVDRQRERETEGPSSSLCNQSSCSPARYRSLPPLARSPSPRSAPSPRTSRAVLLPASSTESPSLERHG